MGKSFIKVTQTKIKKEKKERLKKMEIPERSTRRRNIQSHKATDALSTTTLAHLKYVLMKASTKVEISTMTF